MEKILFRQIFPKQPVTRPFAIIMYIRESERHPFVVHTEYQREDHPDEWTRMDGTYHSTYEKALAEYIERCNKKLEYYRLPGVWERIEMGLGGT